MTKQSRLDKFIENSITVHGNTYDYSKVEYVNAHTSVVIGCSTHGWFEQKPVIHYNHRCGCPKCGGGKKGSTEEFIESSRLVHGDRYDYSKTTYKNNITKVEIICRNHGSFWQLPKTHKRGQGCSICNGGVPITTDKWVKTAISIHGNKYDYSKVNYINSQTNVEIICPKHGSFWQTPNNHTNSINKSGCPKCGFIRNSTKRLNKTEEIIEKLKYIFNYKYNFNKFQYHGVSRKSTLVCPDHGEFSKTVNNLLSGQGCPSCSKLEFVRCSKPEKSLLENIRSWYNGEILENDKSILDPDVPDRRNRRELDIVIPDIKLAIEYCGLYWHGEARGTPNKYHLDKMISANNAGYRLLTIFEDEYIRNPNLVNKRIRHIVDNHGLGIGARQCTVREISLEEAREFLNHNHLQGYHGCKIRIGLFYHDDLVGVMTFGKPNISKGGKSINGYWEISRFATSIRVSGGGSKCLKFFERTYNPKSLISYCDLRWDTGDLYRNMGFTFSGQTPPNYWYTKRNNKRVHRYALRKGTQPDDNPILTEWENRQNQGWDRIWDCGNLRFIKQYE